MRILITGSSGFIGKNLVSRLKSEFPESSILGIDRTPTELPITQLGIDLYGDIAREEIQRFKPHVVYHLAAQVDVTTSVGHPSLDGMLNYISTANLIEGLVGGSCERIIYTNSGGAIYSQHCDLPISESGEISPSSPYGVSKFASELLLDAYTSILGYKLISLRLSNVYGFGHKGGVITKFFEALQKGVAPVIYGSGQSTRDYVYISDVVHALIKSMSAEFSMKVNIATGVESSLLQLVENIGEIVGIEIQFEMLPGRAGEVSRSCLDPREAMRQLGWNPKFSLEQGLADYLLELNKEIK